MEFLSFTIKNKFWHLIPVEDYFQIVEKNNPIVAIADGITRDPRGIQYFQLNSLIGRIRFALRYPRPSPAEKAAETYCHEFINYLKDKEIRGQSDIKKAFNLANKAVSHLNSEKISSIDYLENDYWACVASGGVIRGNVLFWGYIGDCGVSVFNKNGKLKFRTSNDKKEADINVNLKGKNWSDPIWRAKRRKGYRNNPKKKINGKLASYGALTGETTALEFIKIGRYELNSGDYVIFYTDGIEEALYSKGFADALSKYGLAGLENYCRNFQKSNKKFQEGTLVALLV